MPNTLRFGGWATTVEAKTAAYTVKPRDNGKLFTNRGAAGGVTFTLPLLSSIAGLKGVTFEFFTVAAQAITIASNPADSLVVHGDAAADSIATAATIGQHIVVVCDGTGWLVISNPSAASAATAVTAVTLAT